MIYEIYDIVEYFYENKMEFVITIIIGGVGLYIGSRIFTDILFPIIGVTL